MTVGMLASALGISHPSVSETRRSLEAAGLIQASADSSDGRRRVLALTAHGRALVDRLSALWQAFDAAARALDAEAGGVTAALDRLEAALARQPLGERIREAMARPDPA